MRLRISEVKPIAVRIPPHEEGPQSSWTAEIGQHILVRTRDADGTVGWGGCFSYRSPRRVYRAMEELRPIILEKNFTDVAEIAGTLEKALTGKGREARWAAAGIELAAWDLLGKQRGTPVSEILNETGQPLRSHIPVYASLPRYDTVQDVVRAAAACAREGFRAIKLHQTDVHSVAAARQTMDAQFRLMLDVNCAWSVEEAIAMAQELEPYDLRWLEEPIAPADDYDGLSRVRQHTRVPIACGENTLTEEDFRRAIAANAADIYQPSLLKVGGLTSMRQIAAQIAVAECQLAPHSYYFGRVVTPRIQLQCDHNVGNPVREIERGYLQKAAGDHLGGGSCSDRVWLGGGS